MKTNEVLGVCVVLEPSGPTRLRVYSVISPLASRGGSQTTAMEDEDRFLVDTSSGEEVGTKEKHTHTHVTAATNISKTHFMTGYFCK